MISTRLLACPLLQVCLRTLHNDRLDATVDLDFASPEARSPAIGWGGLLVLASDPRPVGLPRVIARFTGLRSPPLACLSGRTFGTIGSR